MATKASVFRELLTQHPALSDSDILTMAMAKHPEMGMTLEKHSVFPAYYRKELARASTTLGVPTTAPAKKVPNPPKEVRITRASLERSLAHEALVLAGIDLKQYGPKVTVNLRKESGPTPKVHNVRLYISAPKDHVVTRLLTVWPSYYSQDAIVNLWKARRSFTLTEIRPVLLELRHQRNLASKRLNKNLLNPQHAGQTLDALLKAAHKGYSKTTWGPRKTDIRRALRQEIIAAGSWEACHAEIRLAQAGLDLR